MLPLDFIEMMQPIMGNEMDKFTRAISSEPITSIRANNKVPLSSLPFSKEQLSRVPWCESGYYLNTRPQFTLEPLMHAGCYYVQEASSMFLHQVLEQYVKKDAIVLDLCAAPGGKSTLISEYVGEEGLLVSNEVVRQRVFILSENIQKWGNGNTVVTHNTADEIGGKLPNLFDCVVVDAPCSGEGMFRKDEKATEEWSKANVKMCATRQREILNGVWEALKPGGILIYSTCTFNPHEDEENAEWIVSNFGAEVLPVLIASNWGITQGKVGYHFYPHKAKGEGFYICVLRKAASHFGFSTRTREDKKGKDTTTEFEKEVRSWFSHPERWALRQTERFITAYPARWKDVIDMLWKQVTCISVGCGAGELRGKSVAPQHSLSMLKDLQKNAFLHLDVDESTALSYLRCEALSPIEANQQLGYVLVCYKGQPLGFAKNVGNRYNNLYPNEWRIRKL